MPEKGEKGGECARTVCRRVNAEWFNQSTEKYYCATCASKLNTVNKEEAKRLYGGPLCILDKKEPIR